MIEALTAKTPPPGGWNLVGYARVSSDEQSLDLQTDALRKAGVRDAAIYSEKVSTLRSRRPQWEECLRALRTGDVLVIWKLDRIARDLRELIMLSDKLRETGVELRSLTQPVDTTSAMGRFFFNIVAIMAEFERDLIQERTRAGLAARKARGQKVGRKPTMNREQWAHVLTEHDGGNGRVLSQVAKDPAMEGVSAQVLYKHQHHIRNRTPYPFDDS